MSKDILGSLMRVLVTVPEDRLGLVQDFANKLAGSEGDTWVQQGKLFFRKEPCWTNGQAAQVAEPELTPLILELVSTVMIPATTGKLVAKEKFVRDTGRKAKVKISYLGDNFTAWFLNGDGKTEDPITEQTLRYHKLRQSSVDGPIIAELGGEAKAETTLSEMFTLMEKQGKSEDGVLLNNGWWNIFYIRDQNGVLRMVFVSRHDGGWHVHALSVENPHRWHDGRQVFSRNSVLKPSEPLAPAQA
jgi:hypothetical protein